MAFGRKQDQIDGLALDLGLCDQEVDALKAQNEVLLGRVALADAADDVTHQVQAELENIVGSGLLLDQARGRATVTIFGIEKQRLEDELTATLVKDEYDRHAAQFRVENGADIKTELDKLFQSDGTYAGVRARAEGDVREEIQTGLIAAKQQEIATEVGSDDARLRFKQEVKVEIWDSEEIQAFREATRDTLEGQWRDEEIENTKSRIEDEEKAREAAFKKEFAERWLAGREGVRHLADIRYQLEEEWKDKTPEEISMALKDSELQHLLKTRADNLKDTLAKETEANELANEFEGHGIDMSKIGADSKVKIYLGEHIPIKLQREVKTDSYYGGTSTENYEGTAVKYNRKLTLASLGDGRFMVDSDSLQESHSPYEQNVAIKCGTVVVIGRKIRENGKERLEYRVAADVNLFYDDDTSDLNITDTQLKVANIVIDGISARNPDVTEKA